MPRPRGACGTEPSYRAHLAHHEVPCYPCCDAHAVFNATWRARSRVTSPDEPLRYQAARLGTEPAEALTTSDRARLVSELHTRGWEDRRIAALTRISTYTTARIREQIGLAPRAASNGPIAIRRAS